MSDLYLIAHKVRGEAAFDVAMRLPELDEDGEEAWIIPTSGHRAFPYWSKPLHELGVDRGPDWQWAWGWNNETGSCQGLIPIPPDDWPDHYPTSASSSTPRQSLAERLGIKRPQAPTITRRL